MAIYLMEILKNQGHQEQYMKIGLTHSARGRTREWDFQPLGECLTALTTTEFRFSA